MNKFLCRSILVVVTALVASITIAAQVRLVYSQANLYERKLYGNCNGTVLPDSSGTLLALLSKFGFARFDLNTNRGWIDQASIRPSWYDYFDAFEYGNGIVGNLRTGDASLVRYDADSGFRFFEYPEVGAFTDATPPGGPIVLPNIKLVSIDGGANWLPLDVNTFGPLNTGGLTQYAKRAGTGLVSIGRASGSNEQYVVTIEKPTAVRVTGLSINRLNDQIFDLVRVGSDTLLAKVKENRSRLVYNAIGDTTIDFVDSLLVDGVLTKLDPLVITPLVGDSVFYIDRSLWCGILRHRRITKLGLNIPSVKLRHISMKRGNVLMLVDRGDSLWCARFGVTSVQVWHTWTLQQDFGDGIDNRLMEQRNIGDWGATIQRHELVDFISKPGEKYPIVTGSLLGDQDKLPKRRMFTVWATHAGQSRVITDAGCVVAVESPLLGRAVYPTVLGDNSDVTNGSYLINNPELDFRERGLRPPVVVADEDSSILLHSGSVIRRFRVNGDLIDTLANLPASAVAKYNDSTTVSSWNDTLRIHTGTKVERRPMPGAAHDESALAGSASSICLTRSGALLCSIFGTDRRNPDSSFPRRYRSGGIVRSTDLGATWTVAELPNPNSRYIYGITRLPSGTLLSVQAKAVEDTSVIDPAGIQSYSSYRLEDVHIIRSADDGFSWQEVARVFYNGSWVASTGRFLDWKDGKIFATVPGSVMVSTNDGLSWVFDERIPTTIRAIDINRKGNTLLVAAHDGLYELDIPLSVDDSSQYQTPTSFFQHDARLVHRSVLLQEIALLSSSVTAHDLQGRLLASNSEELRDLVIRSKKGAMILVVHGEYRSLIMIGD